MTTNLERAWEQLAGIEKSYAAYVMKQTGLPGMAIGLVSMPAGQAPLVRTAAFGVRRLGAPELVDADTVFPLASVSKPIASTLVAMLFGDASAWLDVVPDLGLERSVTYAQLFSHRSGLPDHAGDLLEDLGYSREEIIDRLRALRLNPASAYAYTNFGLTAAAVRAVQGRYPSWESAAQAVLYGPYGMTSTSSRNDEFVRRGNRTWGHRHARNGGWACIPDEQRNPDAQSPAGGVTSSVRDLIRWMQLHFEGSPVYSTLQPTHAPYDHASDYGYGWIVRDANGDTKLSHSGAFELGAATSVVIRPKQRWGLVVLTNGAPIGIPETLCAAFELLVSDSRRSAQTLVSDRSPGKVHPDQDVTLLDNIREYMDYTLHPPRKSNDARGDPKIGSSYEFTGTYASTYHGTARFVIEEGALVMYLGPDGKQRFILYPVANPAQRDVFVYDARGETGERAARLEFSRFSQGAPFVHNWHFALSYPQQQGGTCPFGGIVRAWSLEAKKAGRVRLRGPTSSSPVVDVTVGLNHFANAGIVVGPGDRLELEVEAGASREDYAFEFDIDVQDLLVRKGT
jgi:CubicO group peptidase (beta-lactamase class C family)